MRYDYVVIGAGVAGATTALVLARNGYHVALLEKREQTLPLLRGFSRKGVHFDTGFHYTGGLGADEPLDLFFRYLELSDELVTFPFREEGFDLFRSMAEGFEFEFPCGYGAIRDRLVAAFPQERAAIEEYLRLVRDACASMPYLNLAADFSAITALQAVHGPSLAETLDRLTRNRLLKCLLGMHCLLYGVGPEEIPFTHHARIIGNYYLSARGIRGGGPSLAAALDKKLASAGVDVRCGTEVAQLTIGPEGKIAGVRLADEAELSCTGCIATIHPRLLLEIIPPGVFFPAYVKRLQSLEETTSAFMVYAVSERPLPLLAGANLFLFPEAASISSLGSGPLERNPLYVTAAYRDGVDTPHGFIGISPTLFPEKERWGESPAGKRSAEYRSFKQEMIERMHRQIETLCPELQGAMQHLEGCTPLTFRDFTGSALGGMYGVKHMVGQYNPHAVTRLGGLYLAGQGVVSPGVLGAVLSGFIASGSILGHDRLRRELAPCS